VNEKNRISGRVKRYARVGTAIGGTAARMAKGRLTGTPVDRGVQASDVMAALGGLKGPLMKVAQILSTVPDILPEEYVQEFTKLQSQAPAMGWAFVRRRMKGELGADWQSHFETFEREAAAAASLGQVHKATDHQGRLLACKIQYPDMASAVEADLSQLKLAFGLYRRYDPAIDPSEIHKELSERLREELDYKREAANMALYRDIHTGKSGVHVPEAIPELCTDRLLTMNWLEGTPLMQRLDAPLEERNQIASNMFRAWYLPLYHLGVLHGDPHLGNYSVCEDNSLNLLDFGCIRIFPPSFLGAVIDLYKALRDNDEARAVHAYEVWGFKNINKEIIAILNQWAEFLYAPLLKDKKTSIQEQGGSRYGAQVVAKVHRQLKEVGGITPPREFVLMDRAAIGLGSVFTHLQAELNWHRMFHELIDDYDEQEMQQRQTAALEKHGITGVG